MITTEERQKQFEAAKAEVARCTAEVERLMAFAREVTQKLVLARHNLNQAMIDHARLKP